jgi:hypothetical protein
MTRVLGFAGWEGVAGDPVPGHGSSHALQVQVTFALLSETSYSLLALQHSLCDRLCIPLALA